MMHFLWLAMAIATPPKAIILMLGDDYGYTNVGFAHGTFLLTHRYCAWGLALPVHASTLIAGGIAVRMNASTTSLQIVLVVLNHS